MMRGCVGEALVSHCGGYRWTLSRTWDGRPHLLVCMFNPSTADAMQDDPTIRLLCQVAAHNGYGGFTVVNAVPLRSPTPGDAAHMVNTWDKRQAWDERDRLQHNLGVIEREVRGARGVLLAWGALGMLCPDWIDRVLEAIHEALPDGVPLLCLGTTKHGYPKHPMARGAHKVRPDAPLVPWVRGGGA